MRNALAVTRANDYSNAGRRLSKMQSELSYAWARTDGRVLQGWALSSGGDFTRSLSRRVRNVGTLIEKFARFNVTEIQGAIAAHRDDRLKIHAMDRANSAVDVSKAFVANATEFASGLTQALKDNPGTVGGQLLTTVVVSLIVSGGPDGDGGAPDLDLLAGISAHRSIFTHSILLGATLETALLSIIRLTRLIDGVLPHERDPLWDEMARRSEELLHAGSNGAGLGMAYHMFADGLVQPAAYHDFPFSMPIEGHQAVMTANAAAEALDLSHKEEVSPSTPKVRKMRRVVDAGAVNSETLSDTCPASNPQELALRTEFAIHPLVSEQLTSQQHDMLRRCGTLLDKLASGSLSPISPDQIRFVQVARCETQPQSQIEKAWMTYTSYLALARLVSER